MDAVLRGTRTTVYRRDPATFDAGQLQLCKVSSYTDLGQSTTQFHRKPSCSRRYPGLKADFSAAADSHHLPDDLDGTLFLGLVQYCSHHADLYVCFCWPPDIPMSDLTTSPHLPVCVSLVQHITADNASVCKTCVNHNKTDVM